MCTSVAIKQKQISLVREKALGSNAAVLSDTELLWKGGYEGLKYPAEDVLTATAVFPVNNI